jgi:hypothetical protein
MSTRKVCINHPSSYYTGKEQSPLHFGLSAEGYDINSIMEGYDKDLWIVEVRNSKKVWTKKEHINKMTYEIPLITETTEDLRTEDLRTGDLRTEDLKDCDAIVPSVAETVPNDTSVPSVPSVPIIVPSDTSDTVAEDSKKTKPKVRKTATAAAKTAAKTAKPPATDTDAISATAATAATAAIATDSKPAAKPAATSAKPLAATAATAATATDYTLFITYRIQQLKKECADNKKNYDCARYEWKEYKNKPEELREIMVAARQYASDDTNKLKND